MPNEKSFELTRSLYKQFKSLSREQMQTALTDIYMQGVNSIQTTSVDLEKLRTEIGAIKGIGENRLNEIMAVIEKYTTNTENPDHE